MNKLAISEAECVENRNEFARSINNINIQMEKLYENIKSVKKRMSKIDPDLETIQGFTNEYQVQAFQLYKRAQVRIKLLSSIVKITGMINAAAGFIATLVEVLR